MSVKLFKNRYVVQIIVRYVLKLRSTSLTFTLMESEILLFRRERNGRDYNGRDKRYTIFKKICQVVENLSRF